MGLAQVVRTKFWLASGPPLLVTLGLIALSCRMLQIAFDGLVYFGGIIVNDACPHGLAIGLGALYPNLRDDNPAKIVSGFGGTLCPGPEFSLHCRLGHAAGHGFAVGLARGNVGRLDTGGLGGLRRAVHGGGLDALPPGGTTGGRI